MHFRPSDTFWNFFTLSSTQDSCFPLLSAMSFSQLSPFFLTKDFNTCPVWPLEGVDGGGFFLLPGVVFLVFSVVFCSVVFLDLWSFIPFTAIQMAVGLSNQKSKWFTFCFCAVKTVCFVPSSTESPWPVQTGESEASVTPCTITQPVLQHPLPPSSHEPVLMTQQHQTLGTNTTHHYCLDGQMLSCMGMGGGATTSAAVLNTDLLQWKHNKTKNDHCKAFDSCDIMSTACPWQSLKKNPVPRAWRKTDQCSILAGIDCKTRSKLNYSK